MMGCVWVGESCLSHDKWQIKLLSQFFPNCNQPFMNDSNSKNNNSYGFENSQMDVRGCVWAIESFLSYNKWKIKLLSNFILQFIFYILWMTQTEEKITCRVSKIHKWIWGMCMIGEEFLKEWQVWDKSKKVNFSQFAFNHLWMTQQKNNNL